VKQGDRVQETTTTTGTGSLTLAGATAGHRTFLVEVGETDETTYLIQASDGAWEISRGTLTGTTLTRTLVKSSTGALLNLPAGTHYVSQVLDATTANGNGLVSAPLTLASGTITASEPALDITQTWNNSGVTFEGMTVNVTDTASAAGSQAIACYVNSSRVLRVLKTGVVQPQSGALSDGVFGGLGYAIGPGGPTLINDLGAVTFGVSRNLPGPYLPNNSHALAFGSNIDIQLWRDAAATLAQRNGTNAQTSRIYNTYTDASNYERFAISWNANTLELNTEAAGTGTKRNIVLNGANRAAYSTAAADLAACLVAHGLMSPAA
jgi:hypothetical protein